MSRNFQLFWYFDLNFSLNVKQKISIWQQSHTLCCKLITEISRNCWLYIQNQILHECSNLLIWLFFDQYPSRVERLFILFRNQWKILSYTFTLFVTISQAYNTLCTCRAYLPLNKNMAAIYLLYNENLQPYDKNKV